MKLEYEILVNEYGQGLIQGEKILHFFKQLSFKEQQLFFAGLLDMIIQSKPQYDDIETAILVSQLRPTFTPCVLLRKGFAYNDLKKIIELPENEWTKSLLLLISFFRIAYQRRFKIEHNNPDKWWYWDLSDENNINKIKSM